MSEVHLWIKGLIVSVILLSSAAGVPFSKKIELLCDGSKVEGFVRKLVASAAIQLPDPIFLPRISEFVTLTDGTVSGLSSLEPVNSKITCNNGAIEITAELRAKKVEAKYRWLRDLLTRTLEGIVKVRAETFKAFIRIGIENFTPLVKTCTVTEFENFVFDVTGEEYITWPEEKITGPAKTAFEGAVNRAISDTFKESLTLQLEGVILSVKGVP